MIRQIIFSLAALSLPLAALAAQSTEGAAQSNLTLEARLGQPFRDNAVLQQKIKLPIWGRSLPGAQVMVNFNGQSHTTTADHSGRWSLSLEPMDAVILKSVHDSPAGKTMTVTTRKDGEEAVTEINNLIMGDVWLCAGQSNIAGGIRRAGLIKNYPPNSVNDANYPALRNYRADEDTWDVCSPETVVSFSRVAFFFARRLQEDALVPIGVITTAVGGSNIESWLNQAPYPAGKHFKTLVQPHVGYGIRGMVWYQGESNEKDKRAYHPKLKSLIEGWRAAWGQGPFPVHYVQLPGLSQSTNENPAGGDGRAEIRQAFTETLALPNTGMAVTIDIGTPGEHPPNKYDTGIRLARSVLKDVYEMEGMTGSPLYKDHTIQGSRIRITFTDDAESGLIIAKKGIELPEAFLPPTPTPNAKLQWLSIQAQDGSWHWADAIIDGSELIVYAEHVKTPIAVRYAYTAQPLGHLLYNMDGMPVGPFTTCGYDAD